MDIRRQTRRRPQHHSRLHMSAHYAVAEIAEMWNLSKDAVHRIFQNEPGILVLGSRMKGRKRPYTTLRIPQSVLERVHRQYLLYGQ